MTALSFANVGKCYKVRGKDTFWALRDFTLDVEPGEIIGIVGSNGAGKSTLLKIVSRITLPTTGAIVVNGRIGSLLEVGTGFHQELTGLENIYFNGAVIGIPRREIDAHLSDIIDFSGVRDFIDTPVKRYSSGMYTRLAFAIAAHLDVENMFIDEVLAVGDAEFQRKCLAKMGDMAKSGRTILFVSHDMNAITRLCTRAVWLERGCIMSTGDPQKIVQDYITHSVPRGDVVNINTLLDRLPEDPTIKITGIQISQNGNTPNVFFRDYPIKIEINYTVSKTEPGLRVFVRILDDRGTMILRSYHDVKGAMILNPGEYTSTLIIPKEYLSHRNYEISIGALVFNQRACTGNIGEGVRIPIQVETIAPTDCYPEEALTYRPLIEPNLIWETVKDK